jgi:hypothetical protein
VAVAWSRQHSSSSSSSAPWTGSVDRNIVYAVSQSQLLGSLTPLTYLLTHSLTSSLSGQSWREQNRTEQNRTAKTRRRRISEESAEI